MESKPIPLHASRIKRSFCSPRLLVRLAIVLVLLLSVLSFPPVTHTDSPPNIVTDIPWTDTGGAYDPSHGVYAATFGGVTDIAAAFNNARRGEEIQLGRAVGAYGALTMPSQASWDALSGSQKALFLLNAERVARGGSFPAVIGLPFQDWQTNIQQVAQNYANYLVANNLFGHNYQGTPSSRIDNDPVLGSCHEFLSRAENIAGFWSSGGPGSNRLPVERSVYNWIYVDAASSWGHREAALLQDKDLTNQSSLYGFKNNVNGPGSEGFIGIGIAESATYNPYNFGFSHWGTVVVLNLFDPISTGLCPWDLTPTETPTPTHTPTETPRTADRDADGNPHAD